MGTASFAVPALEAVERSPCELVAVVTRPDRASGRGQKLRSSPVALAAEAARLRLMKPENVNAAGPAAELRALAPDLLVVVAFGAILSGDLLGLAKKGAINLHGSLLPRYRGAAPVERALWDGCAVTGVTTIWMDEGIDTGDILLQRALAVRPEDDAHTLAERLAVLGAELLAASVVLATSGNAPRVPQGGEGASYARKLTPADGVVDWNLDAVTVWNRLRAMTPRPGARTAFRGRQLTLERAEPWDALAASAPPGTVLEVVAGRGIRVACAPGSLLVRLVRPQDKRSMPADEWARGARLAAGARLGEAAPERSL